MEQMKKPFARKVFSFVLACIKMGVVIVFAFFYKYVIMCIAFRYPIMLVTQRHYRRY